MPEILLATLNAKFIHAAFGLRYLFANLGELQSRAAIAEFDINQRPADIAETLLEQNPAILGLGVYIWNVAPTTELIRILKNIRPDLIIVLGGPEVSFEFEHQDIVQAADYLIPGEADLAFAALCRDLLAGRRPSARVIPAPLPDLTQLRLPYEFYNDRDLAHRVIYVEASRGCPFTCEFCLSSLDIPVRQFPLDPFLEAMDRLLTRGARQFKFVDRTFNLHLPTSRKILEFFLDRLRPGLFLHFEMVPDRLPEGLRELIARFPAGALQFEVGIQTLNSDVEERISRRQNHARMRDNFQWLRSASGVHIHADLIAGLPGETLQSFARGFDQLLALGPQEIQVGILKRLRGTPIMRHDAEWAMRYNPAPPYELLQNRTLTYVEMQRLRRFARFWDLFANSGNFRRSLPCLWQHDDARSLRAGLPRPIDPDLPDSPSVRFSSPSTPTFPSTAPFPSLGSASTTQDGPPTHGASEAEFDSPFWAFRNFSEWLTQRGVKTSGMALTRQFEAMWEYLVDVRGKDRRWVTEQLRVDYESGGRSDLPRWMRDGGGDGGEGSENASPANEPRPGEGRRARVEPTESGIHRPSERERIAEPKSSHPAVGPNTLPRRQRRFLDTPPSPCPPPPALPPPDAAP